MSDLRAALEEALAAMTPALATAWENMPFTPVAGTPYQRVSLLLAEPLNAEYGRTFQQGGIFQVSLMFPPGTGAAPAEARAALLRSTFHRGATFTKNGLNVVIARTPGIMPAMNDDDGRYVLPVSIPILANFQN